ncbi:MAG TPA: hypothetical protein VMD27_08860 [Candidatus Aquilonibacter sp.]|nr:hypothetical protein [Candidatus Aquilonibacter sp.]
MKIPSIYFLLILIVVLINGCVIPMSPVTSETRTVSPLSYQTKSVTLKEPMVWYDTAFALTKGIRFPDGTYLLEAEDNEYFYFQAPRQIEYRTLQNGSITGDRLAPGGIFFKRGAYNIVPAGAYISVDERTKTLTWKLGADFLDMEGSGWTKNF